MGANIGLIIGGTVSYGIAIAIDPDTGIWDVGVYADHGFGLHGGANADVVVDITISGNNCLSDLEGLAFTGGFGIATPVLGPHAGGGIEGNFPLTGDAEPTVTFSGGIGVGAPIEGHGLLMRTNIGLKN